MPHRSLGVGTAVVTLALVGGQALAQQPNSPPATPVTLRVMVVHAGKQPGPIDKECADLPRHLGPMKFGTLRLIQQRRLRLRLGESGSVPLPTGPPIRMLPVSIHNRYLHMYVEMPGKVNGRIQLRRGQPMVLGGLRHDNGHLIVYIEPEF